MELKLAQSSLPSAIFNPSSFFPKHFAKLAKVSLPHSTSLRFYLFGFGKLCENILGFFSHLKFMHLGVW